MQVLATQCLDAPHGKVRDAWEAIATVLSTLSTFQVYGGVKWEVVPLNAAVDLEGAVPLNAAVDLEGAEG